MKLSKGEERVMWHLRKFGSITPLDAIKDYGNTRLADTIFRLRKKGYNIVTYDLVSYNRYGEKVTFANYVLEEEV